MGLKPHDMACADWQRNRPSGPTSTDRPLANTMARRSRDLHASVVLLVLATFEHHTHAAQLPTRAWVELCALPSPHANDGTMKIRRSLLPPSAGGDLREVVLDWTTNQMYCGGDGPGASQCSDLTTPTRAATRLNLSGCRPCQCTPEYRLPAKGSTSRVVSDYAVDMCDRVVTKHGCAFHRAVVVGLGTG